MKFYRCKGCGKIVGLIKASACPTKCCGEAMEEMIPGTTDGAREKHVPEVSCEGNLVTVCVGAVEHPMLEKHFIEWIALETKEGMQRKPLTPGQKPCAVFALSPDDAPVAAYEYCNLHGLWKKEF